MDRLSGSLTGTLVAGTVYRLSYDALIQSTDAGDSSATASGAIQLSFVPESSTALLVLTGLLGLTARRRWCA